MKRRAPETLEEPHSKVSPKFEFLELSVCGSSTEARQPEDDEQIPHSNLTSEDIQLLNFHTPITIEKFKQMLPSIGHSVKNVRVKSGNLLILPSIAKHCKNLNRIELKEGKGSRSLDHFRNLKEMKLPDVRIATHAFRECLTNSPDLESLEIDHFWYETDIKDLPELLPNLKSLRLRYIAMGQDGSGKQTSKTKTRQKHSPFDYSIVLDLLKSNMLTKFSFKSKKNCDKLLEQLQRKHNLEELAFKMNVYSSTFTLIGELKNLKVLAITNSKGMRKIGKVSPSWPAGLTRLALKRIVISHKDVVSIIDKLRCLEELHIVTMNADKHLWLRDKVIISEIETIVGMRRRGLKIFFSDKLIKNSFSSTYKSNLLEIIYGCAANKEVEPLQIMISC